MPLRSPNPFRIAEAAVRDTAPPQLRGGTRSQMGDNRALKSAFRGMATLAAHGVLLGWRVAAGCAWLGELLLQHRLYLRDSHGRRGRIPVGDRFLIGMSGASFAALAYQALRFVSRN